MDDHWLCSHVAPAPPEMIIVTLRDDESMDMARTETNVVAAQRPKTKQNTLRQRDFYIKKRFDFTSGTGIFYSAAQVHVHCITSASRPQGALAVHRRGIHTSVCVGLWECRYRRIETGWPRVSDPGSIDVRSREIIQCSYIPSSPEHCHIHLWMGERAVSRSKLV